MTHQLLYYADDVSLLRDNIDTAKKNKEILIVASKKIGVEVNADKIRYIYVSLSECEAKS
jgi:hypothetical protein